REVGFPYVHIRMCSAIDEILMKNNYSVDEVTIIHNLVQQLQCTKNEHASTYYFHIGEYMEAEYDLSLCDSMPDGIVFSQVEDFLNLYIDEQLDHQRFLDSLIEDN